LVLFLDLNGRDGATSLRRLWHFDGLNGPHEANRDGAAQETRLG
jgi:hypothetical protein